MKSKNVKIGAGVLIIVAAIIYLIFSSMGTATAAYYITVGEALKGQVDANKTYRIEGKIDTAHAVYNTTKSPVELKFQMYDQKQPNQKLTVIFNDVEPDNFKEATDAVVDGKFNSDGTFKADTLNLKCPSKYEAQTAPAQKEGTLSKFLKSVGLKSSN